MKKTILMLLFATTIFASEVKLTKGDGYIFTKNKEQLEKVISLISDNDIEALNKYMFILQASNQGGYFKENSEIYIEDYDWGGFIKFRAKGSTISWWTVSKAVKK